MDIKCLTRKRIWEVDCWSLDAAVAASFDWRELINMLQGHGNSFNLAKPESLLELQAQCAIHEYCHSENEVSVRLESLLNDWHKPLIEKLSSWSSSQVTEYALTVSLSSKKLYGSLFWALGSDARNGFDCIRRRFHQRFQMFSIRK